MSNNSAYEAFTNRIGPKNNVSSNEETQEETKIERKRVSFDLRADLHKELKLLSIEMNQNMYEMIEEAIQRHLQSIKQ